MPRPLWVMRWRVEHVCDESAHAPTAVVTAHGPALRPCADIVAKVGDGAAV